MSLANYFLVALASERIGNPVHAKHYKAEADRLARSFLESSEPGSSRCGACGQPWESHAKGVDFNDRVALSREMSRANVDLNAAFSDPKLSADTIVLLNRVSAAMNRAFALALAIVEGR